MPVTIRGIEYYHASVKNQPGAAHHVLAQLAEQQVNLLAFSAIPIGVDQAQLMLFPDNVEQLARAAERLGIVLVGPQCAFLVQGDDRLGAFVDIHCRLAEASINVFSSTGVADGRGGFGYLIYVGPEDFAPAAKLLGAACSS